MTPASASPPPPRDRSEIGQRERRGADKQDRRGEGKEGVGKEGVGRQGERKKAAGKEGKGTHETCGPLDVERHVKDDGRALILYTRGELEHGERELEHGERE